MIGLEKAGPGSAVLNCQALPDPERGISIMTCHDQQNGRVVVGVRDEGAGIPEEMLDHIFDSFFTTKRDTWGTGLGLSISARIVEDHKGRLEFDSEPGKGTTVSLVLPVPSLQTQVPKQD